MDYSKLGPLKQATPWTAEEELAEAQAWGFDSIDTWADAMAEAFADEDRIALQDNLDSEWLDELPPVGWTGLCNNYFYQIDRRQKGQVVHITRTGARVIEFENGDVNTCTAPNDFIPVQSERER